MSDSIAVLWVNSRYNETTTEQYDCNI